MKTIDILVYSYADVQKERLIAERLLRSVAAELDLPLTISCLYGQTGPSRRHEAAGAARAGQCEEDAALRVWFCEDPELSPEAAQGTDVPNPAPYDLIVWIFWARLGARPAASLALPGGGCPRSAANHQLAWTPDQTEARPEPAALHVYRNRSIPATPPLEPRAERERFFQQWDTARASFAEWMRDDAFVERCVEYGDLGEFESAFRNRFRNFITARLGGEVASLRARNEQFLSTNPFRGLGCFDVEHARFFYGRTKEIGDALDALQQQAAAKRPFLLILGPGGCGKSSLARAGILPVLTGIGITERVGPWRFAITQPGAAGTTGDPLNALAAALLERSALPELPGASSPDVWRRFAAELRERPERAVLRLKETLDHVSVRWVNQFLDEQPPHPDQTEEVSSVDAARPNGGPWRLKPKVQLALVVDQLEDLFSGAFAPELQRTYLHVLAAFVRSQRVTVLATLRTDFYSAFQERCGPNELNVLKGRFELSAPGPQEIDEMIRLPAQAVGLRYEPDPQTGRSLDTTLVQAEISDEDRLPILEHLLARLYAEQSSRQDGVLRWSDYVESGGIEGTLADHAEQAFSALNSDAQAALEPVLKQLARYGVDDTRGLLRQPVPYRTLVSGRHLEKAGRIDAKSLVDQFIKEGLFWSAVDPERQPIVGVMQETLLRRWPRARQQLSDELKFSRMRDRLHANFERWHRQGRKRCDLLRSASSLDEARILLKDSRPLLTVDEALYLAKSLEAQ
ncbi:MAG: ATP-binding protein, partial [Verrucomicrobia bacterium]|nr:ATP-binding protein [Verrucomicrobiota bacterium]